ncbi:isochorismatase family protein [Pigmentiphaga aceris]|uniref:Isochorismatase family protein n=1 Tax=Pigmentiphaga aceris TaxID=1940612 RepID=A0A5C0AWF5_9BURK|nr:isochorismatase family protein [Pigmentiphaga aceris]QEI06782.1 isochorismatase family protein [Pigmentiphaga aceris]
MDTIRAKSSLLVLVDYQARLMPAIHDAARASANAVLLAQAAKILGIPVLGTEQNPTKLGPNVEALRVLCDEIVEKMHFDACADGLLDAIQTSANGARQIVVAGCEAHVCLLQTALGLLRAGKQVWVVANACGSRKPQDHDAAMHRLSHAGAIIVTHEMVAFEWLGSCEHPGFREVLELIKSG